VQKRIDTLKAAYPDVDLKLIDTSVEFTKGNYEAAISTCSRALSLPSSSCCCSCAISAPPSLPRSRCRCRSSRVLAMDILGFSLNLVSFLAITL